MGCRQAVITLKRVFALLRRRIPELLNSERKNELYGERRGPIFRPNLLKSIM